MQVDRPVIRGTDTDRVVLWVSEPLEDISHTYAAKYIRWGEKQTFGGSDKVPDRSTWEARRLWYDITNAGVGSSFWPMAQKYRHIAPTNPDGLVCNHNLFYLNPKGGLSEEGVMALSGILSSTLIALLKHFYGRYAGSEGTLKTEVVDTVLLEVPDPRGISSELAGRMGSALEQMAQRQVTHLVEDTLLNCHSEDNLRELLKKPPDLPRELRQEDRRELDDAVLELIGVSDKEERAHLLEELYLHTTLYYREQRTQDIQSMENRASGQRRGLTANDLAASIWDSMHTDEREPPLLDWIKKQFVNLRKITIPDGKAQALGAGDMFHPNDVIFKSGPQVRQIVYANAEHALLIARLADLDIRGEVKVPEAAPDCKIYV